MKFLIIYEKFKAIFHQSLEESNKFIHNILSKIQKNTQY